VERVNSDGYIYNHEKNASYCVCGYILSRICKYYRICEECINSAGSKRYNPSYKYSKFLHMRCYKPLTLFFCDETFNHFYEMVIIIHQYLPLLKGRNCDLVQFFLEKMNHIKSDTLKNCHGLPNKIMKYFIKYRIKINCFKECLRRPIFNSKTMAMHSIVK